MACLITCLVFLAGAALGTWRDPEAGWGVTFAVALCPVITWFVGRGALQHRGVRPDRLGQELRIHFSRRTGRWAVYLGFCLGFLRATNHVDHRSSTALPPASASRVIEFEVVAASMPGPSCRTRLQLGDRQFLAHLPVSQCDFERGQMLRVPRPAIKIASSRWPRLSLLRRARSALANEPSNPRTVSERVISAELRRSGADAVLYVSQVFLFHEAGGDRTGIASVGRSMVRLAERWQRRLRLRAIRLAQRSEAAGLVVATALGMRDLSIDRVATQLSRSGLGHILAISGVHVGLVARFLWPLGLRLSSVAGIPLAWGMLCSWLALGVYVWLCGAPPSALRAAFMAIWAGVGALLGRPVHGPTQLALVAAVLVALRPSWIGDLGFQLSVIAMWVLIYDGLEDRTRSPQTWGQWPELAAAQGGLALVRQSWRLCWAMAPLWWWHFGYANFTGVLVNCLALPVFAMWVLPLGVAACIGPESFSAGLTDLAAWGARWILDVAALSSRSLAGADPLVFRCMCLVGVGLWFVVGRLPSERCGWLGRCLPPRPALLVCVALQCWRFVDHRPSVIALAERSAGVDAQLWLADRLCLSGLPSSPRRWWSLRTGLFEQMDLHGLSTESIRGDPRGIELSALAAFFGGRVETRGCLGPSSERAARALEVAISRCHRDRTAQAMPHRGRRLVFVMSEGAGVMCWSQFAPEQIRVLSSPGE